MMQGSISSMVVVVLVSVGCTLVPNPAVSTEGDASSGASGTESETVTVDALALDCSGIPVAAEGATLEFTPSTTGLRGGATYTYSSTELPAGLTMSATTGEVSGVVEAAAAQHTFDITVEEVGGASATTTCTLLVRPRLSVSLAPGIEPYCLQQGDSLLDWLDAGTGDDSPVVCDHLGGSGDGRIPQGIEVDSGACTLTGAVAEDRLGTWSFVMRATQSGVSVHLPFCVTNDVPQGYEIVGSHSDLAGATLEPITRTYDPTADVSVGTAGDPRYEITAPGVCGASCLYSFSFLRTEAPIDEGGFSLHPDGLVQDGGGQNIGFFHELRMAGPPVPDGFRSRPWVLSVAVYYCIASADGVCQDAAVDGDGSLEISVIMVPEPT